MFAVCLFKALIIFRFGGADVKISTPAVARSVTIGGGYVPFMFEKIGRNSIYIGVLHKHLRCYQAWMLVQS